MIKVLSHLQPGAPVLSGEAGALTALLDAALLTGFGNTEIDSISSVGLLATATINAGVPFQNYDTIEINGANPNEYNGEHTISNITTTTFDFVLNTVASSSASGGISCKSPALGWEHGAYSDVNIQTYKAPNNSVYYKVDDSGDVSASGAFAVDGSAIGTVFFFESMQDINTGVPVPDYKKQYIVKSLTPDSIWHPWYIIGDENSFYLLTCPSDNVTNSLFFELCSFGDYVSFLPNDVHNQAVFARNASLNGDTSLSLILATKQTANWKSYYYPRYHSTISLSHLGRGLNSSDYTGGKLLRNRLKQVGLVAAHLSTGSNGTGTDYWNYTDLTMPNTIDGILHYMPIYIKEEGAVRGRMPGLYHGLQYPAHSAITGVRSEDSLTFPDGVHRFLSFIGYKGAITIDITGPWE